MWIGSYKMRKNEFPPYFVVESLRERYYKLFDRLKRKIGDDYQVKLKVSYHSESAYIFIYGQSVSYQISFRNHLKKRTSYDKGVYLWAYHTWEECEEHFFNDILNKALEDMNKLKLV